MKTFKLLIFSIAFFSFALTIFAQSGKKDVETSPTPSVNPTPEKKDKDALDPAPKEEFQFILAGNLNRFIEELNKFGKLRYRVAKAFNYGGDANSQKFAAVLKYDPEDVYEYDWLTSPNRRFIEPRLNAKARQGFYVTHILPVTGCYERNSEIDQVEFPTAGQILQLTKGDIFLLEKYAGKSEPLREYKVFTGKIGVGKSPTTELQTALDGAPAGFQPFKLLFTKSGMLDFSIAILLERNLNAEDSSKIAYKFFKDVNGFEKEINANAQSGFQLVGGRRIGLVKFALLAKVPGDAVSYILLDADKYEKEFAKRITPGNVYKGMFLGDTDCDENETFGAKLVFAQTAEGSPKHEYKFLKLTEKGLYPNDDALINEFKKFLKEGYLVRDIFYAGGVVAILEKERL